MNSIVSSLAGVRLMNPTILSSGILGVSAASLQRIAKSGAGAVTTKSIGPAKREGHPTPVVVGVTGGILNAVGLSCPPLEESLSELKKTLKAVKSPVIASFYGRTIEEFGDVAERVSEIKPDLLEANISCPNAENELGKPFAIDPESAEKVTQEIKDRVRIPLIMKLSPNVADIASIAASVESAGADAISAVNTVGPGMVINIETAKPVLSNRFGGMSGPAIKPIAVRCVYQIYEVVEIPIIGIGGIQNGRDAIEMMMAGANVVGIGTAVIEKDINIFSNVCNEIIQFMDEWGYTQLDELIGKSHLK